MNHVQSESPIEGDLVKPIEKDFELINDKKKSLIFLCIGVVFKTKYHI